MGQILKRVYHILFLLVFSIVTVQAIRVMVGEARGAAVLLILFLGLILYILPGKLGGIHMNCKRAWIVVQAVSVAGMLFEMYMMELKLSWDWQVLISTAYQYAVEGGADENLRYFAAYSNNQFWLACLILFFKVIHKVCRLDNLRVYKWISILIAGMLTQASLWLIYRTARLYFNEKKAFLTGCLAVFFLPVYLYAMFAYTDVPGMFLVSLTLYLYSKVKKTSQRRMAYLVLMGCAMGFAFKVKVTTFIILIAIMTEEVLSRKDWKKFLVSVLLVLVSMAAVAGVLNRATSEVVVISETVQEKYEFPLTHWIMMGLKKRGGYNDSDVKYTSGFSGYEEKRRANIEVIKKRIADYGPDGLTKHILGRKLRYTWCDSCLAGDYYGAKYPFRKNFIWQMLSEDGSHHWIVLLYTWPYYILVLLGLLFSGIAVIRKEMADGSFFSIGRLSMLGLFLFLSVWECNSRYLVCFIPVLIPVASEGIFEAAAFVQRFRPDR